MLNQLPQSLQNLLNNKSKNLNLLTEEYQKITVSEEQSNSYENIFLASTVTFSLILGILTYINFQKTKSLELSYISFKNNVVAIENSGISIKDLETKIENLKKYSKIDNDKRKISSFFSFLSEINKFLNDDNIIQINYNVTNRIVSYQIFVNSNKKNLDQDLNSFFQSNLKREKIELIKQTPIPENNLVQYEFKGNYELR